MRRDTFCSCHAVRHHLLCRCHEAGDSAPLILNPTAGKKRIREGRRPTLTHRYETLYDQDAIARPGHIRARPRRSRTLLSSRHGGHERRGWLSQPRRSQVLRKPECPTLHREAASRSRSAILRFSGVTWGGPRVRFRKRRRACACSWRMGTCMRTWCTTCTCTCSCTCTCRCTCTCTCTCRCRCTCMW